MKNRSQKDSKLFLLSNKSDARKSLKSDNFGLYYDDYYSKEKKDIIDKNLRKSGMLAGDFRPSYQNNFTQGIVRAPEESFLASSHNFETFLAQQKEDLPRFSILNNYDQIMRIMTQNYMRSQERDAMYRNRDKKDLETDEDYAQYVDEQANTRKMSNILKRLNTPKKRTNMNYHRRQQIKEQMGPQTQMSRYTNHPSADIKLKAMMF